ncbi:MAG: ECF-type sigma factor [Planctomycetota bacterium]
MAEEPAELTVLLQQANRGDAAAGSKLFRRVQSQLHSMAEQRLSREQAGATIQATVLVHDAFLQLVGADQDIAYNDRKHFYVLAAQAMRRILIDRARSRRALKRGGPDRKRADIVVEDIAGRSADDELLALHEALKELTTLDPRQAKVVELRHFGGYSVDETADLLELSPSTIKQEFAAAKAWLFRQLKRN